MDIDLNADLGEGFGPWRMGDDEALLDIVSSANVACGFHAGDPVIMERTVRMARARGVDVGAHVGFPDRQGFGRRLMQIDPRELAAMVTYQLGALAGIARAAGHRMTHMSFHGALGNMAAADAALAAPLVRAVADFDPDAHRSARRRSRAIEDAAAALRPARRHDLPGRPRLRRRGPAGAAQAAGRGHPRRGARCWRACGACCDDGIVDHLRAASACRCRPRSILLHGDTPGAVDAGAHDPRRDRGRRRTRSCRSRSSLEQPARAARHKGALSLHRQSVLARSPRARYSESQHHEGRHDALLRLQDRSRHRRLIRHRRRRRRAPAHAKACRSTRWRAAPTRWRHWPSAPAASRTRIDVTDLAGITQLDAGGRVRRAGQQRRRRPARSSFLKADAEDIDLLVDVNLRAVLHLCRLVVPGMVGARPRPRRQHQLDRRRLQLRRQLDLPRHQGGGQHAVAPAAHRLLRQARARHRDLPGPRRDRHLRPRPRRLRGDPRALRRGLRTAAGRRTSPTRSPSPSPRRSR